MGLRVSHQRTSAWEPTSKDDDLAPDPDELRRARGSRGKKKQRKGRKK